MFGLKTITYFLVFSLIGTLNLFAQPFDESYPDYSYDEIKDRISCMEISMPIQLNNKVAGFIDFFAIRNRTYTQEVVGRTSLYFPLFEKKLKEHNLPDELKYLSIVESALKPQIVSRASAVGLWQFISSTGRAYKLYNNWFIDDRMNPEKSTEAACKFLKWLHNVFGDWELALAAYNCGPGNVRKAIRRSGNRRSFWEIYPYLPRETRSYVPQFYAITYLFNHLHQHGFHTANQQYHPEFDTLNITGYLHLETLSKQINECHEDLFKWNPSIKKGVLFDSLKTFALKIPTHWKEKISENRESLLDSASKVEKEHFKKLLASSNIPGSVYGKIKRVYRVRNGDVLGIIADRFNVRVADLKKWNKLRGSMIRVGQKLNIWVKSNQLVATSKKSGTKKTVKKQLPKVGTISGELYKVKSGDSLWTISRSNNISVEKIKSANQLTSNKIKPGQSLIIPN